MNQCVVACLAALLAGSAAAAATKRPWTERVVNAEAKTPMEIVKSLGAVSVDVTTQTAENSKAPSPDELTGVIKARLEAHGIKVISAGDAIVHVFVRHDISRVSQNKQAVGELHGIYVDARLVKRGYLMEQGKATPVIGGLLRGLNLQIASSPSRDDIEGFVKTAVEKLFDDGGQAKYDDPPEWEPLGVVGNPIDAEISFNDAQTEHVKAEKASLVKALGEKAADDPFGNVPAWAPRTVNVLGNPFKGRKTLRLAEEIFIADFVTPVFKLSDLGVNNAWAKKAWLEMLRGNGIAVDSGPRLSYELSVSDALRVGSKRYWALMGSARVVAPNVLFDMKDRGFVRSPARIGHTLSLRFTTTGDLKDDVTGAVVADVRRFERLIGSDWFWCDPAALDDGTVTIRFRRDSVQQSPGTVATPVARPKAVPDARPTVTAAPDAGPANVPPSKLTDGVFNYLTSRQFIEVPEAAARRFAAQVAWEVESASVGAGDDAKWWDARGGERKLNLSLLSAIKRENVLGLGRKADALMDRIRDVDPLMYNAYDNLLDAAAGAYGEKPVFTDGYLERLKRARPIGKGTLSGEWVVDVRRGLDDLSYHAGSDEAKERFQMVMRQQQVKFEGAKMIRAYYVPQDGSRGNILRYFWYKSRPAAFDDMVKALPANAKALSYISREPVEVAPDKLSDAEGLASEMGKIGR